MGDDNDDDGEADERLPVVIDIEVDEERVVLDVLGGGDGEGGWIGSCSSDRRRHRCWHCSHSHVSSSHFYDGIVSMHANLQAAPRQRTWACRGWSSPWPPIALQPANHQTSGHGRHADVECWRCQ